MPFIIPLESISEHDESVAERVRLEFDDSISRFYMNSLHQRVQSSYSSNYTVVKFPREGIKRRHRSLSHHGEKENH